MRITKLISRILYGKEGEAMMAMLWASKIIHGKKTFGQVPKLLKEQVREILEENDLAELAAE